MANKKLRIAVIYTHFPHYRSAVFKALSKSSNYDFQFYYDPKGVEKTIVSGKFENNHHMMRTRRLGPLMWQFKALGLVFDNSFQGFVFLGNPFIVSTWLATLMARIRNKPVVMWTHGWLRGEKGLKSWVRCSFYGLANGLMLYGERGITLGHAAGFNKNKLFFVGNSLDFDNQNRICSEILNGPDCGGNFVPEKQYFLAVARLTETLCLDQAIIALSQLEDDVALVVVGDGPCSGKLAEQAKSLGVDVRFYGAVYDEKYLGNLFLGSCAVVSPGKVGLLAMHALAYGAFVITHDDFDHQMPEVEVIEIGVTGDFFRRGNIDDLAQKMASALEHSQREKKKRLSRAHAKLKQGYTPRSQVKLIETALQHFVESKV